MELLSTQSCPMAALVISVTCTFAHLSLVATESWEPFIRGRFTALCWCSSQIYSSYSMRLWLTDYSAALWNIWEMFTKPLFRCQRPFVLLLRSRFRHKQNFTSSGVSLTRCHFIFTSLNVVVLAILTWSARGGHRLWPGGEEDHWFRRGGSAQNSPKWGDHWHCPAAEAEPIFVINASFQVFI